MFERHMTLVVPELLPSNYDANYGDPLAMLPMRSLGTLLARADDCFLGGGIELESLLFNLFGYANQSEYPSGAVAAYAEGLSVGADNVWLRAAPVFLEPQRAGVYLLGADNLEIDYDELEALNEELNGLLLLDSVRLHTPSAHQWYVELAKPLTAKTHTIYEVLGHNIENYLAEDDTSAKLNTLFTEVQMLLHQSEINNERQRRGKTPVNGIWMWGCGRLPKPGQTAWRRVWSDEPVALGLAKLHDIDYETLPFGATVCFNQMHDSGDYLVVINEAQSYRLHYDERRWHNCVLNIEEVWLRSALQALKNKQLTSLTLYPGNQFVYHLTNNAMWRFWRRRRPLSQYLSPVKEKVY